MPLLIGGDVSPANGSSLRRRGDRFHETGDRSYHLGDRRFRYCRTLVWTYHSDPKCATLLTYSFFFSLIPRLENIYYDTMEE